MRVAGVGAIVEGDGDGGRADGVGGTGWSEGMELYILFWSSLVGVLEFAEVRRGWPWQSCSTFVRGIIGLKERRNSFSRMIPPFSRILG